LAPNWSFATTSIEISHLRLDFKLKIKPDLEKNKKMGRKNFLLRVRV
jgi:hypothetical protein